MSKRKTVICEVAVVVVVDSHIQRIVLATEETTVTQRVTHGDNPLLRPTGIQLATNSYAALQAMAPTNIKTVHQTSLLLLLLLFKEKSECT